MRRKRSILIGILCGSVLGASAAGIIRHHSQSSSSSVRITSINGVEVSNDRVVNAGNLATLPWAQYKDGSNLPENIADIAVHQSLLSSDALKSWQICGAELRAKASIFRAWAQAIARFPRDLPWNRNKVQQAHDRKSAQRKLADATLYEQAALLAENNGIACSAGPIGPKARFIGFRDKEGKEFVVPDTYVLFDPNPVEVSLFEHSCPTALSKDLERTKQRPIDKKVSALYPIDTFSQQTKAEDIASTGAWIKMLRSAGIKC